MSGLCLLDTIAPLVDHVSLSLIYTAAPLCGTHDLRHIRTCYSPLKLSDLVGCLNATDRVPVRTAAVEAHADISAVEAEAAGVGIVRP